MDSEVELTSPATFQTLPTYYTELNTEWLHDLEKMFPVLFDDHSISKDLVLSPYGEITVPVFPKFDDEDDNDALQELISTEYLPKIEETKKTFEYKELQLSYFIRKGSGLPSELVRFSRVEPQGEQIQLDSMREIKDYIGKQKNEDEQQMLKEIISYMLKEMDVLNGIRPVDYDIIVYLNLHGSLIEHKLDKDGVALDAGRMDEYFKPIQGVFPICVLSDDEIASGRTVTCLSATCPGITHLLMADELERKTQELVVDQYRTTGSLDVEQLQKSLRQEKKKFVKVIDSAKSAFDRKFTAEVVDEYRHDVGWGIARNTWLDKMLVADEEDFGWPIKIFRDKRRPKINEKLIFDDIIASKQRTPRILRSTSRPYKPFITTDELIQYLLRLGYTNILLIDASCGDHLKFKTARELRQFTRWATREGLGKKGGKRTKKNSKKTKRKTRRFI